MRPRCTACGQLVPDGSPSQKSLRDMVIVFAVLRALVKDKPFRFHGLWSVLRDTVGDRFGFWGPRTHQALVRMRDAGWMEKIAGRSSTTVWRITEVWRRDVVSADRIREREAHRDGTCPTAWRKP